jgi:hypothetical protein
VSLEGPGVEIWLKNARLSAEQVQGLLVSPVIKQILCKPAPLNRVGSDFTCRTATHFAQLARPAMMSQVV